MKMVVLILLLCFMYSCSMAQYSETLSVKSIDSIFRAIRAKNNMIRYRALDSSLSKYYYLDKKSKQLLAVEIINGYYAGSKDKFSDYFRFIYYFHKEELIKLYITYCTSRKNCKKGIFYFSNGKVIHKEGALTEDSCLKRPLEFSKDFKTFVISKSVEN